MPVNAPTIPTSAPRRGRGGEANALFREGMDDLRVARLRSKRRGILKGAAMDADGNPTDPDVRRRLARIDARMDEIRGISAKDRADTTAARARAVKATEDVERARAEEGRAKETHRREGERHKVDMRWRENRNRHTLKQMDEIDLEIEKLKSDLFDRQRFEKLREKAAREGLTNRDIATSPEYMAFGGTMYKEAHDAWMNEVRIAKLQAETPGFSAEDAVAEHIAENDFALAAIEQLSSEFMPLADLDPAQRFQAFAVRIQRMSEAQDPQLRQVFKTVHGLLQEADRGGAQGQPGDEQLTDEEMDEFMAGLARLAETQMNVRKSLDKARGKGPVADLLGLGGGGDDGYRPSVLDYQPRSRAAATAADPQGTEAEQKAYLDEMMEKYAGDSE